MTYDRLAAHLIVLAAVALVIVVSLMLPEPAGAGDETCRPEPITVHTPSGVAGCTLDGPTSGKASRYPGSVVAAQWCTYPWTNCGSVRITSHQTGVTVITPVGMFCDCYWFSDRRLVDLTPGVVAALGLDWAQGIYPVTVEPIHSPARGERVAPLPAMTPEPVSAVLPDTAAP